MPKGVARNPETSKQGLKPLRGRVVFNHEERKRLQWVMKYFDLPYSAAIKMSTNMMCEMAQEFEKGSELYFERKVGSKILKRRIIIT